MARYTLKTCWTIVVMTLAASLNAADRQVARPNILFLFADDLRSSAIHGQIDRPVQTPRLDRLANQGLAFPHAYIMGAQNGAVCVASRAMLMTGMRLQNIRRNGHDISPNEILLGETLGKAGYSTYGIGKWHNGIETYQRSFRDGAEILFGGRTTAHLNSPPPPSRGAGKIVNGANRDTPTPDPLYKNRHSSEIFADAAIAFLKSEKARQPFFMYVAFTAPHDPRHAPQAFYDRYPLDKVKLPENWLPQHPFDNGHTGRDEVLLPHPRDPEKVRKEIQEYYGIITHMDEQIGRILDALDATGAAGNTIVIFAADNGLAVGQHGLLGKQSLYEHSVNVPLIWRGPGIPVGKRSPAYVYLTELFPTLCDMLDIEVPSTVEVKGFLPSLKDPARSHHQDMYFGFREMHRAVSDRRYKLIEYNVKGDRHTQLFDLKTDPLEMRNLADKPEFGDIKARLSGRLQDYRKQTGDKGSFWDGF